MKKYELLQNDTITVYGTTLYHIRALRDFGDVEKGDIGGYIESEHNLSHYDNAWVSGDAQSYGNARIYGNACIYGDARISGDAWISGNAWVSGDAWISGNAQIYGNALIKNNSDYIVLKNNWSSGRYFTYTRSNKMWAVGCFYGTGEELIKQAYEDSQKKGKCYEASVRYVESIYEILEEVKVKQLTGWKAWLTLILVMSGFYQIGHRVTEAKYEPQIDGLTKQLDHTQKQLKKVSEESADKTARIAELTNNGG